MIPEGKKSNRWIKYGQELGTEIQRQGNAFEDTLIVSERERRSKSNNVAGSLDNIGNKVASRITNIKIREYMQKSCIRQLEIRILPVITEVISRVLSYILDTSGAQS